MASIQKRGKKYAVIYSYVDNMGKRRQKWETVATKKEARIRKAQIESEMSRGTFVPPSMITVQDFLKDYVEIYGKKKWGLSAYASNCKQIEHYINPLIGDEYVQEINRRSVDMLIAKLQKTPPVSTPTRQARTEYITPAVIEKVIKLLHCAFRQAVR